MAFRNCVYIIFLLCLSLSLYAQDSGYIQSPSIKLEEGEVNTVNSGVEAYDHSERNSHELKGNKANINQNGYLHKQSVWLNLSYGSVLAMVVGCIYLFYLYTRDKRILENAIVTSNSNKIASIPSSHKNNTLSMISGKEKTNVVDYTSSNEEVINDKAVIDNSVNSNKASNDIFASSANPNYIVLSSKLTTKKIDLSQLMYVVAESDGTRFYLKESNFWTASRLKVITQQLPKDKFIQVFRSIIVNIEYVSSVKSKFVTLENGEELALSRTYAKDVRKRMRNGGKNNNSH